MKREDILAIIRANRWETQGFNALPLFLWCAAQSGWLLEEVFGLNYTHFFYLFSGNRAIMYYDLADWEKIANAYYDRVTSLIQLRQIRQHYEEEIAACTVTDLPDNPDLPALCQVIGGLCRQLVYGVGFAHAIEGITFGSEQRLTSILKNKGVFSPELLAELCVPSEPSFLATAQAALWKIKQASGSEQEALANQFAKKFSWVEATYIGLKPLSKEAVIERAQHLEKDPAATDWQAAQAHTHTRLEELKFTPEERFVVETIQLCFNWQDSRKKHILQTIAVLDPYITQLAEKTSIPSLHLKFALPEELQPDTLQSPDFQAVLAERAQGAAFYQVGKGTTIFSGADFDFLVDSLKLSFGEETQELHGTVACKGTVRGKVIICNSVEQIQNVAPGDILVASMTRPEYLPALQKAAAIVTDEGGITCHAAIVSRELGKPCIIGTKIATQVLKNGSTVEVDAINGVIRVIE